jgi:hypothetical protein
MIIGERALGVKDPKIENSMTMEGK